MTVVLIGVWQKGVEVAGTGKKWALGCGLGCGIPVLLVILLMIGGSVVMMKPFNKAVDAQKELNAEFGLRDEYIPSVDGITPAQVADFMKVRMALVPLCDNFTEIGAKFRKMDELDDEGEGEEPSKREVFGAVGEVMGAAFGIAGNIGRFTEERNRALLNEGMGLGEYIWIYTLVYNSWLGHEPNVDFDSAHGGRYDTKDQKLIRELIRNYVTALNAAGRTEEAATWASEADHLERMDGSGVPWADSEIPANLAATLAPFRTQLEDLYCEATSNFEFSQVRKKGLSITAD